MPIRYYGINRGGARTVDVLVQATPTLRAIELAVNDDTLPLGRHDNKLFVIAAMEVIRRRLLEDSI